jgi:hypothetical protein
MLAGGVSTLGLPKLVSYAATQSRRNHWTIGENSRVKLDQDIRLFAFRESRPNRADMLTDLLEGKMEFKWMGNEKNSLESRITGAAG